MRQFDKMHGLGNDFVIVDARFEPFEVSPAIARAIADRRHGIGCDQLIRLSPSALAALRMDIWNADGSPAEACGNASRCVVALTGATSIETDGGVIEGAAADGDVEVSMGEPRFAWDEIPLADAMDTAPMPMAWEDLDRPFAVNVGNPHVVFLVDDVDAVPLGEIGPRIETDPVFPERINVHVASSEADGSLKMRSWERGAGLTQACGTGACAVAVAAIRQRKAVSPVKVSMPGGDLTIAWMPGQAVRMRGPASHVFSGTFDPEKL